MPSFSKQMEKALEVPQAANIFSPAIVKQLAAIEVAFGGRNEIISILACAPKSVEIDYLLGVLQREPDTSIADLCVAAEIRPSELLEHLQAGNMHIARSHSSISVPRHLPQVVEDLMNSAHDHRTDCATCQGVGDVNGATCTGCNGTGLVFQRANPQARSEALKISGLTGDGKGGLTLNLNTAIQNLVRAGPGSGGALDRLQSAADAILADDRDYHEIMDAETIEEIDRDTD